LEWLQPENQRSLLGQLLLCRPRLHWLLLLALHLRRRSQQVGLNPRCYLQCLQVLHAWVVASCQTDHLTWLWMLLLQLASTCLQLQQQPQRRDLVQSLSQNHSQRAGPWRLLQTSY
jgi:hypothetical protein